ncbi:hypothetical protein ACFPRL_33250 [Pseudoclavibacter helvolus]
MSPNCSWATTPRSLRSTQGRRSTCPCSGSSGSCTRQRSRGLRWSWRRWQASISDAGPIRAARQGRAHCGGRGDQLCGRGGRCASPKSLVASQILSAYRRGSRASPSACRRLPWENHPSTAPPNHFRGESASSSSAGRPSRLQACSPACSAVNRLRPSEPPSTSALPGATRCWQANACRTPAEQAWG